MTRHSKNCTSNPVYTYHEAKKDSKVGKYGSLNIRYGKDGIKDFDCCSISLQPCKDPVITPQGYLYDKAVILEYILTKKKELKTKLDEYEKNLEICLTNNDESLNNKKKKFIERESDIATERENIISDTKEIKPLSSQHVKKVNIENFTTTGSVINNENDDKINLPSFWIPTLTPDASKNDEINIGMKRKIMENTKAPSMQVLCPFSGRPLKLKDLIPVKFKKIAKDGSLPSGTESSYKEYNANSSNYIYVCPITGDTINNSVPCAVLKTSGSVVTVESLKKIFDLKTLLPHNNSNNGIVNKGKLLGTDPINGKPLYESDIILVHRGGTGFAEANKNELASTVKRPALHL